MAPERAVFVDGHGLLYRAWHAVPNHLKTTGGLPTNALYGVAQTLRKLFSGKRPAYGAVVLDAPGGSAARKAELPGYKAHRPPMPDDLRAQLPHLDGLVAAHGFPVLRRDDAEADDVLASLTAAAVAGGLDVWVVSGDKDLAQLVGPSVRWFDPASEILHDAETVRRTLGVPPERIPELLALAGDDVDGIPGVPGLGRKRAADLLAKVPSLAALLADPSIVGGKAGAALRAHADRVRTALRVATLRRDLPVPELAALRLPALDLATLDRAYLALEFWSLLSPGAQGAVPKKQNLRYYVCDDEGMARAALANECGGPAPVAVHVLSDAPDHLRGPVLGLALSPALGVGFHFPLAGPGTVLSAEVFASVLGPWLADPAIPKVAHEHKRAVVALRRLGLELQGVVGDPALASYLVNPTLHLPHRLEQVAREYLHVGLQPIRGLLGSGAHRRRFADLTIDKAGAWSCHLADAAGACWRVLQPRLADEGTERLLREVDLPLSRVLADLELAGIAVDDAVLARIEGRLLAERDELLARIHAAAGRAFNPSSHAQLGAVLFDELGLPVQRRTKTGYAVDVEVLEDLRDAHPVVPLVLRHRTVDKLIAGYTNVLRAAIGPDGRIHPTLQQTVGAAFRLISTEPDLQRTPVRTAEFAELRQAFVAAPGHVLVSADYSQVELRVLAHLSGDEALRDAFRAGADVHRATAASLFAVPPDAVTRDQREVGKTVNFATLYGQGPVALARQLGVTTAVARGHVAAFFATWQGVARWRTAVVEEAARATFVTTLDGRRRYVPELFSNDPDERAYGERICVNTPVQGSAADLCKRAMVAVDRALREAHLPARLVLQIHDELLLEVADGAQDEVIAVVRRCMAEALPLAVPLVVDAGAGASWAEAHR
jgi:DNA polymerase-1